MLHIHKTAVIAAFLIAFYSSSAVRCFGASGDVKEGASEDVKEIVAEWRAWLSQRASCRLVWTHSAPESSLTRRFSSQMDGSYFHCQIENRIASEGDVTSKRYAKIGNRYYGASIEHVGEGKQSEWVLLDLVLSSDSDKGNQLDDWINSVDFKSQVFNGHGVHDIHPVSGAYEATYDSETRTLTCVALDPDEAARGGDLTPLKVVYTLRAESPRLPVKIVAEGARRDWVGTVGEWEEHCGVLLFDTWTWARPGKGGGDDEPVAVWALVEAEDRPMDTSLCYLSAYGIAEPDLGWAANGWLWFAAAAGLLAVGFVIVKRRRTSV